MTSSRAEVVELVRHRCRSHCRPGAGAGSFSETEVPEPMWDRGTGLSHTKAVRRAASTRPGAWAMPTRPTKQARDQVFRRGR
jgi:hypothetical protein